MSNKGFSLLELIVVLSIIALTGFGFANFVSYRSVSELDKATDETLQLVQHAQTLATSNAVPITPTPPPAIDCSFDAVNSNLRDYEVVYESNTLKIKAKCDSDVNLITISEPQINFASKYPGVTVSVAPSSITFTRYSGESSAGTITLRKGSSQRIIGVTVNGEIRKN